MKPKLSDITISKARAKVKRTFAALNATVVRRRIWHFLLLACVAALGFWLWGVLTSAGLPDRAVEFIRLTSRSNRFLAYGFFSGLAMVSVLLGPFTSAPVVPIALLLWGKGITFGLLITGWMVGGMGAYMVGKYFGIAVVSKIVSRHRVDALRGLATHRLTFYWAFLIRLSMPAETGYIFGLVKYNFWKFVAATLLVECGTGVVLIWGGHALVNQDFLQFATWITAGIIIFVGAAYLLRREL